MTMAGAIGRRWIRAGLTWVARAATVVCLVVFGGGWGTGPDVVAAPKVVLAPASVIAAGRTIAFDRRKGNCMACHVMAGAEFAGNIGPPLVAMQTRFPDRVALRAQIWDATVQNPQSLMPPFGRHEILTEREIDQVLAFIYSL